MYTTIYPFSLGRLLLAKTEKGLCLVQYLPAGRDVRPVLDNLRKKDARQLEDGSRFAQEIERLDRYFAGEAEDFQSLTLDLIFGTPKQRQVWTEARKIPYGQTASYKELAHRMHHRGYRFIGQALNKNPFLLVIPCHRVINADGGLGGFGAGLPLKRFLLLREGIKISDA